MEFIYQICEGTAYMATIELCHTMLLWGHPLHLSQKSKWPITEIGCPKSKTEIYALNLFRLHVSPHVTKVILAFNAHVNGNLICSDFSCLASDQAECQASWASSLLLPSCTKVATGGILPTSHVLSLFAEKHRCILSTCRPSYKEMQSGGTA